MQLINLVIEFLTTGPGTVTHSIGAIAPLLLAALIGAGGGLLKSQGEKEEADKQRSFEVERERWSPWTGVHGNYVKGPNVAGNVMQGAGAGASFGQGLGAFSSTGAEAPAAAQGMDESINYSGTSGIGPVANGQIYANDISTVGDGGLQVPSGSNFGPYRNPSAYVNKYNSWQTMAKKRGS